MRISGPNAAVATAPSGHLHAARRRNGSRPWRTGRAPHRWRHRWLIALQGLEDPTERRRQAFELGRCALDDLKIELIGGTLSQATPS